MVSKHVVVVNPDEVESTRILVGGDFVPVGVPKPEINNYKIPFLDLVTKNCDYSLVNLECPLTTTATKIAKIGPSLKAEPSDIRYLVDNGVKAVTLANNHIMDFGVQGLRETLQLCRENGIETLGADENLALASKALSLKVNGKRFKIFNVTENEFSTASAQSAGANLLDPYENFQSFKNQTDVGDFVITIIHGGNEFYRLPNPELRKAFRFFADLGSHAVIGHHPHVTSGYEIYNGVPLIYSLGNLIFHDANEKNIDWSRGYMVVLMFGEAKLHSFQLIPYNQGSSRSILQFMEAEQEREFVQGIHDLSMVLSNTKEYEREWQQFCTSRSRSYIPLVFRMGKLRRLLWKQSKLPKICSPTNKEYRELLNLIRCDAHRQVLLTILSKLSKKEK